MNSSPAFILYRTKKKGAKGRAFYNDEARAVLFPSPLEGENAPLPVIDSLCSRWKEAYDRRQEEMEKSGKGGSKGGSAGASYIDLFQSYQRRYTVKGIVLSARPAASQKEERSYLFILERFNPEVLNLTEVFRHWSLNPREQEIVRLILADKSNKEIATHLGLSLNTIKGYLKLLMRKVGVHSRGGILSILLTGQRQKSQP